MLSYPTLRVLIDHQAEQLGDRTFLIDPENGRKVSFIDLQKNCAAIGRRLLDAGMAKGDRAAFLLDNGLPAAQLLLGIAYAGMVAVPLSTQAGEPELVGQLGHCDASVLFTGRRLAGRIADAQIAGLGLTHFTVEDTFPRGEENEHGLPVDRLPIDSDDPAFLVYTSGTTGQSKGVLVSHGNVLWGAKNTTDAHDLTPADRSLCVLPLYHMNAQVVTLLATLWSGGSVVLPTGFAVESFWVWVATHGCSWFALSPTLVSRLLDRLGSMPGEAPGGLEGVRFARSSSGPLAPAQLKAFEQRLQLPLIEAMGMTEAGGAIFSNPLPPRQRKAGSVGIPWGFEARLVDPQGIEVGRGELGEIAVRGPSVMAGYFKDPAATQQVVDPEGWLRTGDLGYQDEEGYFFIKGRAKEMINRGGEKIAPAEVDAALLAHPGVAQAVAFGIPHPTLHEEIGAAVVLRTQGSITGPALRQFLFERLSPFKVPRRIWVVADLPLGPTGKPLRRQVQAEFASRPGATANPTGKAPMSPMQRTLAALWSQVLNRSQINPWDDFFLLGGDSLSAAALIVAIESELKIELPLDELVRRSTLQEMAAWLMSERRFLPDDLVGVNTTGSERPLFGVCGRHGYTLPLLLVGRELGARQPFYGLQPPGMDWGTVGCSTVPEMAAYYITRMKTVQPEGPYRLLGTSFGGLVVFEMAQQLRAAGDALEFLGLLDTDPPGHRIGRRCQEPRPTPPAPPLDQARSAVEAAGIRIAEAHVRARQAYRINAPIDSPITYFYCRGEAVAPGRDPRRWWRLYTTRGVCWVPLPGQHGLPHQEPQFSAFSAALRSVLAGHRKACETATEAFGRRYRLIGEPQAQVIAGPGGVLYPVRPHPHGLLESIRTAKDLVLLEGWAAEVDGRTPANTLVAFHQGRCLGYGGCGVWRKGRQRPRGEQGLRFADFRLRVPFPRSGSTGEAQIRLFALLEDGSAGEVTQVVKSPHSAMPFGNYWA